jgi:acyl-CoA synthetase (AMP-forming)/AMP-acid ligase II
VFVPLSAKDFIDRAVTVYGERIGIVDESQQPAEPLESLSYARIDELARAQAAALDALDVQPGDRVAIVSHNSARLLISFFGVCGYGRVLVPINFRLSHDEVAYIVEKSGASVLLVDPELEDELATVPCRHKFTLGASGDEQMYRFDVEPQPWEPDEDATATINYTSGTTAHPKGVEITHRNLWINATILALHTGVSDRDVYLHTLPMFHANGWGMPFAMTGLGARHIVLRKIDGNEILRRVAEHGVTIMCASPTVVNATLAAALEWDGDIPGRDRVRIIVAGAPPPTKTIAQVETVLGWEFIQIYGLTETSPLLSVNRSRSEWDELETEQRAAKLIRAGTPSLGTSLRISEVGEVLARSNVVMEGYWDQPKETAEAIEDGWFHTGDGGTIDDEGYLTITDRLKDVIITGGENVASVEVEDMLFNHPDVAEVAVIGVPDEKWGETVKALVVLIPGAQVTQDDLIKYCRHHLAGYKTPTSIEFRSELARTATGKLQKFKLRKPYWEGYDRRIN